MNRYWPALRYVVVAACMVCGSAYAQKHDRNSYLGQSPPELVSEKDHWIGTPAPLTLAELKGKVVWLHFNF